MEVEQPTEIALLDAVRTLDSDSDGCTSLSSVQGDESLQDSLSTNDLSTSIVIVEPPDSDSEPFPEYHDGLSNTADERVWEELFTLAMKEEIYSEQVDPHLALSFIPTGAQQIPLDDMKDLLSNPKLRKEARARFVALTEKVIRLEFVLFRQSEDFLNPEDTAEAQKIASTILDWIAAVDIQVQESVESTVAVFDILESLEKEQVAQVQRLSQMACVVFFNLKKPRSSEQNFLLQLLTFYEVWIHSKFLELRRERSAAEELPSAARCDLARYLQLIWDYLTRCCNNYRIYRDTLCAMRDRFFAPMGMTMETSES